MITIEKLQMDSDLWEGCLPIYQRILELPFIKELTAGTLSARRFTHYVQQDALYLVDFARALALISAKAKSGTDIISFLKYAQVAIIGERELHEFYFDHYKTDCCVAKNSACFAYTHFLISTAAIQSLEEAVAAVLPCFWIYRNVGKHVYQNFTKNNPYEKWILTYADEEFSSVVDEALLIAQRLYQEASPSIRRSMKELGMQSAALEWQFWDVAYRFCDL